MRTIDCGRHGAPAARAAFRLTAVASLVLTAALANSPARGAGVPVDGFLPQVGITLTNEYVDDLDFFPYPSSQPGGVILGAGGPHYDVALLDTGAAVSLITSAADAAFNIDGPYPGDGKNDGFRGTEFITIGGASGFLEASISDTLGLYAGGLQSRTASGAALTMNNTAMPGQTNTSIVTLPPESALPNVLGLSFASQYATRIRNSQPQVFELDGETVRSPAIDFHPLGSQGLGITRKAQLSLLGSSPSSPLHFPNLGNLDIDHPNENPSQPTVVQGGHFLNATFSNNGANLSSQFFFDTGASVTVLSQFKALEMGFDVTLDTPEFTISIVASGGTLEDVPGFFVDQLVIPALGGNLTLTNVPVIVLDVTNVSNPGNIVDGIIGTNVFHGRDIVIDPNPSLGGGGPSAGVYISDPVTTNFNWVATTANANWSTPSSWSPAAATSLLSVANLHHVNGGDQTATLSSNAGAFEVNISGAAPSQTMTLRIESGAKLTTFSGTNIESDGILSLGGGTLDTQFVDLRDGGVLHGTGSIQTGSGVLAGQVENVSGVVSPGDPIGSLEIEGRYSNSSGGTLRIDLAGLGAGTTYDQLVVDGTAALAGTLEVLLGTGFSPNVNDAFTIVTATEGVGGEFESLLLPTGYNWQIQYNAFDITLLVDAAGDFNRDGNVDLKDYAVWRDNADGLYTANDYQIWKNSFGQSQSAALGNGTAVPEPAGFAMAIIGMMFAASIARRT